MTETTHELRAYHDAHDQAFHLTRWERTPPMGSWEETKSPPVTIDGRRHETDAVTAHGIKAGCAVVFTN